MAEYLRRPGETRVSRKAATSLPACDADDRQPPPLTPAQRLEAFQGQLWAWGGPSLHVLTMQCGGGALVDLALATLNEWSPRLTCVDEHGVSIASEILATRCIKEHPEGSGFLRLVLPGHEHRGGPVPIFRTGDVLAFIREFLAADFRFRAVVDAANRLPASASEKGGERELSSPDVALPGAETVPLSTAEVNSWIAQEPKDSNPRSGRGNADVGHGGRRRAAGPHGAAIRHPYIGPSAGKANRPKAEMELGWRASRLCSATRTGSRRASAHTSRC